MFCSEVNLHQTLKAALTGVIPLGYILLTSLIVLFHGAVKYTAIDVIALSPDRLQFPIMILNNKPKSEGENEILTHIILGAPPLHKSLPPFKGSDYHRFI